MSRTKARPNAAIVFLRVSSKQQEGNTSHDTQRASIESYCEAQGLEIVREFVLTESAKVSAMRHRYHEGMNTALATGVKHVVFYTFDREARNLQDAEENERLVRTGSVVLHYALENKRLDRATPDSEFFTRDVLAANSKQYSRNLSTKVRASTKQKAESGWFPGRKPAMGYVNQRLKDAHGRERHRGTIIVPDPDVRCVRVVQREFELRAGAAGYIMSLDEIRRRIIREGLVPMNEQRGYSKSSIARRLQSKFYDARFDWAGVEYSGLHERIVSAELYLKVQATFACAHARQPHPEGVLAGSWMRCATCGCSIVYDPKKKTIKATGEVKMYRYYRCSNGKRAHDSLPSVTEDEIWTQFETAVASISITDEFARELAAALNETRLAARRAIKQRSAEYRAKLQELECEEDRIYRDYRANVLDRAGHDRQIGLVRRERAQMTNLLEQANIDINDISMETAKTIIELATNATSLWKMLDPAKRRSFLEKLLSNPVLEGKTLRYDLEEPFAALARISGNEEWRREWDSNPR